MGNSIGRGKKSSAKVMKISGETIKFKTPVKAAEVVRDHPGLVVVDSEAVKHYGVRAKPLEPHHELDPNRLYFLVDLPKVGVVREGRDPRRVRSAIHVSAKDRLESLMLTRRSSSDLSIVNPNNMNMDASSSSSTSSGSGVIMNPDRVSESSGERRRVKVRLRKGDVERVMRESKDEAQAAERIMNLYIQGKKSNGGPVELGHDEQQELEAEQADGGAGRRRDGSNSKKREKRVSFLASMGGPMEVAVAS